MSWQGGVTFSTVRERLEAVEEALLAPYAQKSAQSAGRESKEPESGTRTTYQRDRDRIVHSNSFRRLRGKTQVFIAPTGDHYATRLSHVLEVSQIARVVSRALGLNEDLAEAIALGHDLGHAPFGHAGQEALNRVLGEGYRHDEQSVRVVRFLEKGGRGLNLSSEVVDGIRTHRKPRENFMASAAAPPSTLEAEVVKVADAIAYINHDVDDAVRSKVINASDLPARPIEVLGISRSERIDTVVNDLIATSFGQAKVAMRSEIIQALNDLRGFLFESVYTNPLVTREAQRARNVVEELFRYFCSNAGEMPQQFQENSRDEGVERRVVDYVAGMTDSFAIQLFEQLFVPKTWPL